MEVSQGGAVAVQGGYDPYAAYGQEAASGGTFLKFNKGEWVKGQNDTEVPLGTTLVANMAELSIGWIRWADGRPAERRLGLLAGGHRAEPRDQLGYTDQALWETDADGKAQDPWTFTNELPVVDPETGEQLMLSMSSKGGIGAMGNLCKAYGKEYRQRDGLVPLIKLDRDSYVHPVYKKVYVPVLPIVDWIANTGVPSPQAKEDEETASAEKPAEPAKAAAGSKTRF
jgi:hypothetical protein